MNNQSIRPSQGRPITRHVHGSSKMPEPSEDRALVSSTHRQKTKSVSKHSSANISSSVAMALDTSISSHIATNYPQPLVKNH
jgi:hypothetical protein